MVCTMKNASCYLRFLSCFAAKNVDLMTMANDDGHEFMAILCIFLEENTKPRGEATRAKRSDFP